MLIDDQAAADEYFERCVRHTMRRAEVGRYCAEKIERANLGYYAGYYNHETRLRVERLFRCCHPYLPPASLGPPDLEKTIESGRDAELRSLRHD